MVVVASGDGGTNTKFKAVRVVEGKAGVRRYLACMLEFDTQEPLWIIEYRWKCARRRELRHELSSDLS